MRTILALALTAIASAAVAAQVPDVCKSVGAADVAAVIGGDAGAGQVLIPGSCSWNGKGANLSVSRLALAQPQEAVMVLEARTASAGKDEVVREEPGIGQRAASSLAGNKRTLTLIAADGAVVWTFTLSKGDQAIDAAAVLPAMRDLARKALAAR